MREYIHLNWEKLYQKNISKWKKKSYEAAYQNCINTFEEIVSLSNADVFVQFFFGSLVFMYAEWSNLSWFMHFLLI